MKNIETENFIETIIQCNKEKDDSYIVQEIIKYLVNLIDQGDTTSSLLTKTTDDIEKQKLEEKRERHLHDEMLRKSSNELKDVSFDFTPIDIAPSHDIRL